MTLLEKHLTMSLFENNSKTQTNGSPVPNQGKNEFATYFCYLF
jgi:hypothetical protein